MCVLAGYVGPDRAAPILIDMLRRQQGLGGGYQTGLATVADGRLHYEKVTGDLDVLLSETPAVELPGNVGIIHSRSEGTGGREWAHPFVNDGPDLAYVANGDICFRGVSPDYRGIAKAMYDEGHRYLSFDDTGERGPAQWSEELSFHASEIVCHRVSVRYRESGDLARALAEAFLDTPSEITSLAVHAAHPDCFAAARVNMPLFLGHDGEGSYAASTALAFPEAVRWTAQMPANAVVLVRPGAFDLRPLPRPVGPVAPLPSAEAVAETLVTALKRAEPLDLMQLFAVTEPLWPADAAPQKAMLIFELLQALTREGKLVLQDTRVPRKDGNGTAPRTVVRWVG